MSNQDRCIKVRCIKVRVKTWEEIKECGKLNEYEYHSYRYDMLYDDNSFAPNFVPDMQQYCGKVIKLIEWDGKCGNFRGYGWALPMLSEIDIKEHNRNGANT